MIFSMRVPKLGILGRAGSVGLIAVAFAGTAAAQAGQPSVVFRGETSLILTDVVVLDKDRRPVRGLAAADFVILEDGQRRPVVAALAIDLPDRTEAPVLSGPAKASRRPSTSVRPTTNQIPETGRLVVVMMDRTIQMEGPTLVAKRIANQVIAELGPSDFAAVVRSTGFGTEGQSQSFTNDQDRLRAAVEAPFVGLVNPPQMNPSGLMRRPQADLAATGDCLCGLCVLETIARVADSMAAERSRHKAIFWIGSAIVLQDDTPYMSMSCPALKEYRDRAMRALATANVTFHALDPSGVETLSLMADAFPGDRRRTRGENLQRQGNLAVLPEHTGGRTVLNTNHPEEAVPQIFRESSSYYLLGFTPTDPGNLNRRRKVEIRVNRAGVDVRARSGVYAPSAPVTTGTSLEQLVAGVLPRSGLPMTMQVTASYDDEGSSQVTVALQVAPVRAADTDGSSSANLIAVAVNGQGNIVLTARQQLRLSATSETTVMFRLPLPPGDYEMRVGVEDSASNVGGSIYDTVTVHAR